MPAFILIDDSSGYIWADLRDIDGKAHVGADMTPAVAARIVDESLGEVGREYEEHGRNYLPNGASAYHVYRVDVRGSEAVAVVHDGQDQETIDAVTRDCEKVAVVTWKDQVDE